MGAMEYEPVELESVLDAKMKVTADWDSVGILKWPTRSISRAAVILEVTVSP